MFIGILRFRDVVFPNSPDRERFDKSYEFVISSIFGARTALQEISKLWQDHVRKVTSGEVSRLRGQTIQIDESIDTEFRRQVESFVNAAVRALKQGMQELTTLLRTDIGFLFQKQAQFEKGLITLHATDGSLAEYLRETRDWSERLMEVRNSMEHGGWILPRVTYSQSADGGIIVAQPPVSGMPAVEFVMFIFDRLICPVEDVTVHCLQTMMPAEAGVTEIPLPSRVKEMPERFKVTVAQGGAPIWHIVYHSSPFEQT